MAHSTGNDLEMNDIAHSDRPARDHDDDDDHNIDNAAHPLLADGTGYMINTDKKHSASLRRQLCPAGIASLTVHIPDAIKDTKRQLSGTPSSKTTSKPSRWNTLEFYCYYIIVAVYLILMVRAAVRLSDGEYCFNTGRLLVLICVQFVATHPNYWIFEKRLSDGWILGRKVVSKAQCSVFRVASVRLMNSLLFFSRTTQIPNSALLGTVCHLY
jgi:hypothetical protein